MDILKQLTNCNFTYIQDTVKRGIWDSFSGEKDDVFIFNKNGEKTSIKAGTSRDATSTSHMGEEDATCADAKNIKVVKTLLEELNDQDGDDKMCRDITEPEEEEGGKMGGRHGNKSGKGRGGRKGGRGGKGGHHGGNGKGKGGQRGGNKLENLEKRLNAFQKIFGGRLTKLETKMKEMFAKGLAKIAGMRKNKGDKEEEED